LPPNHEASPREGAFFSQKGEADGGIAPGAGIVTKLVQIIGQATPIPFGGEDFTFGSFQISTQQPSFTNIDTSRFEVGESLLQYSDRLIDLALFHHRILPVVTKL